MVGVVGASDSKGALAGSIGRGPSGEVAATGAAVDGGGDGGGGTDGTNVFSSSLCNSIITILFSKHFIRKKNLWLYAANYLLTGY